MEPRALFSRNAPDFICNRIRIDHVLGQWRVGNMNRQHVRHLQQRVQRIDLTGIAQWKLGLMVVIQHSHAHGFGKNRNLGANVAVAQDA